jgi:hypothetical protein
LLLTLHMACARSYVYFDLSYGNLPATDPIAFGRQAARDTLNFIHWTKTWAGNKRVEVRCWH